MDFINSNSSNFILQVRTDADEPELVSCRLFYGDKEIKNQTANTGKGSFRTSYNKLDLPEQEVKLTAKAVNASGIELGKSEFVVKRSKNYLRLISFDHGCKDVCDKIVVDPPILDMGYVRPSSTDTKILSFKNNTDKEIFFTVTASQPWVTFVGSNERNLASGEKSSIKIGINWRYAAPGQFIQARITLFGKGIKFDVPIGANILPDMPDCFKVSKNRIDFGTVSRGSFATETLTLSTMDKTPVEITSSEPWLDVEPKKLVISGSNDIKITVRTSRLPKGTNFSCNLFIAPQAYCQLAIIPIIIKTGADLTISMRIGSKNCIVDGNPVVLDAPPEISKGRTLVPIRFISESFGADVLWDKNTKKITVTRFEKMIELTVDKQNAKVDGKDITLDSPPIIKNGRTLVPLRFISEAFGADVDYLYGSITILWSP